MTEAAIQSAFIKHLRMYHPDVTVITNPLSSMPIQGSKEYRMKVIGSLKAQGWQAGQPDLIIWNPKASLYRMIGLELKTPDTNPFRIIEKGQGRGDLWINGPMTEARQHVWQQIEYMAYAKFDMSLFMWDVSHLENLSRILSGKDPILNWSVFFLNERNNPLQSLTLPPTVRVFYPSSSNAQ